ncbi:ATP-dependent Clp protease ATP-binding subunit, partial [Candidatus Dojkabacteria bacterium]
MIPHFDRFSTSSRETIEKAVNVASDFGSQKVDLIHFFYALISQDNSVVDYFMSLGIDINATKAQIEKVERTGKKTQIEKLKLSQSFRELLTKSFAKAMKDSKPIVTIEDMFVTFLSFENHPLVKDLLTGKNISIDSYLNFIKQVTIQENQPIVLPISSSSRNSDEFFVEDFLTDMNETIKNQGKEAEVVGRDAEIDRLIHVLSRKYKNNPILIGEPGVGKTAIVEGLVYRVVNQINIPVSMSKKKFYSLSIAALIAGSKLRGDVEERLQEIIDEVSSEPESIIFIDEIHMIVGAGSTGARDSMDVANILKPYLSNGSITVIGATTKSEYQKSILLDQALARRFQPIYVDELSKEATIEVLVNLLPVLEEYHGVTSSREILNLIVELSDKYIKDRYFPDKAIDVLDETFAYVKINRQYQNAPQIAKIAALRDRAAKRKQLELDKGNFKGAHRWKTIEEDLTLQMERFQFGKSKSARRKKVIKESVTLRDVIDVVKRISRVPTAGDDIIDANQKDFLASCLSNIVGQDDVVNEVLLVLKKVSIGFKDDKKPAASFLFLGPTGVGKTEMAKSIAKGYSSLDKGFLQLNMSEFMEPHSVAKLIGSPPGYVGYEETSKLVEFVRSNPHSVVLFDEIEKAHPSVLNILLQILDEGYLTDNKANKVFFNNCIIVLTSNIGVAELNY